MHISCTCHTVMLREERSGRVWEGEGGEEREGVGGGERGGCGREGVGGRV